MLGGEILVLSDKVIKRIEYFYLVAQSQEPMPLFYFFFLVGKVSFLLLLGEFLSDGPVILNSHTLASPLRCDDLRHQQWFYTKIVITIYPIIISQFNTQ